MKLSDVAIRWTPDWSRKSEEELLALVLKSPQNIQHIKNPSEAVQLAAVKYNGLVIKHIENPSEEVQLAAIRFNAYALVHIKTPTQFVIKTALTDQPLIKIQRIYEEVVKQVFANNNLLVNKWIRYGEAMRNQI